MCASIMMTPASAAATLLIRMSRFLTCEISCASTPSNSSRFIRRRMPSVTATTACSGFLPVANAFATGRNPEHAVVAVTEGILRLMNREELEGVLAHEISHVKNRDILISSVAAALAGVIMMLAHMARWAAIFGGVGGRDREGEGGGAIGLLVTALVAPIAALLIQMAISRSREYHDARAHGALGRDIR